MTAQAITFMGDLTRRSPDNARHPIAQNHTSIYHELDWKLRQVAELLMQGADNKTIAKEVGSPVRTVKMRVRALCRRFDVGGGRANRVRLTKVLLAAAGQTPAQERVDHGLTAKEAAIVAWVCEGLTNAEVAARMHTTRNGVGKYLQTIYDKVGMFSRLELAVWYEHYRASTIFRHPAVGIPSRHKSRDLRRANEAEFLSS